MAWVVFTGQLTCKEMPGMPDWWDGQPVTSVTVITAPSLKRSYLPQS